MSNEIRYRIALDGTAQVKAGADGVAASLGQVGRSAKQAESDSAGLADVFNQAGNGLRSLAQAAALGTLLTGFVRTADVVVTLNNQLKLATGSAESAATAYTALFDIAQRSRTGFAELGSTYASIARATSELGISQGRLLAVTEAIGNAAAISGGSAESMKAALTQLGQGFASGALRGEELNSVMEQQPRLAQAIADGLGVTIGQLRELGKEGKLTAQSVFGALESQGSTLAKEVASSVTTVAQSITQLTNAATVAVGELDRVSGSGNALAQIFGGAAKSVGDITKAMRDLESSSSNVSVLGDGIAVVFETITVLGANVAYVIKGIGNELGGLAAQAAAIATGSFAQAGAIRDQMVADAEKARADVDRLTQRLLEARQLRQQAERALSAGSGDKAALFGASGYGDALAKTGKAAAATKDQLRELAQEQAKQQSVMNAMLGVTDSYAESLTRLQAMRKAGRITEAEYLTQVEKLIALQPSSIALAKKQAEEQKRFTDTLADGAKAYAQYVADLERGAVAAEDQLQRLVDEERAAGLAAAGNISLAEAIQRVAIERLREQQVIVMADGAAVAAIQREIEARERLMVALRGKATREANADASADALKQQAEAAKRAADDWERTADDIRSSLTDAFRRAFESGEDFGSAFAKSIGNELKARLAAAVAEGLAGLVMQGFGITAGGGGGAGGTVNQGTSLVQAVSAGKTLYGWGQQGYGYLSSYATGGYMGASTGAYTSMANGQTLAAYGVEGAGATTGGVTGSQAAASSSTGSTSMGMYALYAAIAVKSYQQAQKDYDEGFRSAQSRDAIDRFGPGISPAGGAETYGAELLRKLGLSDRMSEVLSGASHMARIFGRAAPQIMASGVAGTFGGAGGFEGQAFADIREKGGWLRSDKSWTEFQALPEELTRFLSTASKNVFDQAAEFGKALGLPAEQLGQVSKDIKVALVSPEADTADAIKAAADANFKALGDALSGYGDELVKGYADAVKPLAIYGETTVQTIERVGGAIKSTNQVLSALGLTALQASIDGGKAAASLADLFGGTQGLQQAAAGYLQNYYTETERAALSTKSLTETLASVGLALPATRDEFRRLVEAQDPMAAAGQRAIATLLGIEGAFADIVPAGRAAADILQERAGLESELLTLQGNTTALRARERDQLDASNRALYDQVKALEDLQDVAKANTDILAERAQLELELLTLQGNTAAIRALERGALDGSNRALYDQIKALEDLQDAAKASADILAERAELETQLLTLQGNTTALRARERAGLDESNRALYDQVRALEDVRDAADAAAKTFEHVRNVFEQLRDDLLSGVSSAYTAVAQSVDAERQRIERQAEVDLRALEQQADRVTQVYTGMLDALADAAQQVRDQLAGDDGRAQAVSTLQQALADLQSGRPVDADALRSAAGTAARLDTAGFATSLDYQRALSGTGTLLREVSAAVKRQQTTELGTIAAQQVKVEAELAKQLEVLDDQLDQAKSAAGSLVNIDRGVQSVADAMRQLYAAIAAANVSAGNVAAGPTGQWLRSGNTEVYGDPGGASATRTVGADVQDTIIRGKTGDTYSVQQARQFVNDRLAADDITSVYQSAVEQGINSNSLDLLMAWTPGTAMTAVFGPASGMDAAIRGKSGATFTLAQIRAFVNDRLAAGDIESIYYSAIEQGINSSSLDTLMGWDPGTSLAEALRRKLPAFATGSSYVPQTGPALVHQGERILTATDNAALMQMMAGGGNAVDLAALLRTLIAQVAALQAANSAENHAIASHTNKGATLLDDVINGGATLAVELVA